MARIGSVYGVGQALFSLMPPPQPFANAPTSYQTNYDIGQIAFTPETNATSFYIYAGAGVWSEFATNSGDVTSIIQTTNQISASSPGGAVTLSIPSTFIAPGTIASTTTITSGTTLTATLGNITATNGNVVLGTAGNKILSTSVASTTTAGANSFGTVALSSGTATIMTSAVTASSMIFVTRQAINGSTGLGELSIGTIMAGTSFVLFAGTPATPGTPLATDSSIVAWMIVN